MDIKTPEDLITFYYGNPDNEQNRSLRIHVEELDAGHYEITLIDDNLEDDSLAAEKIVMKAKRDNEKWIVIEIKKNWKCHSGRGHINWGTDYCN